MKLDCDGFVTQIAYNLPVFGSDYVRPRPTSLCRLFWRFWFKLLLGWPLAILAGILSFVVFATVFCALGFPFAYRFNWSSHGSSVFAPYRHWPTIFGHRIWPIWIAPIVATALYGPGLVNRAIHSYDFWLACAVGVACAGIISIGLLTWNIFIDLQRQAERSQTVHLCAARWRAFKDRVCPIVTFERKK